MLVVDKPAGLVVHPGAGHAGDTLVDALAGKIAGGDPERPGDRAPPRPRHVGPDRRSRAPHGGIRAARRSSCASARSSAPTSRSSAAGRGRGAGRIEAPIGRDRDDPTRISLDSDSPRDAVTHFEVDAAVAGPRAAPRAARDRPHAPDPRPSGGDRPAGRRRPGLRRPRRRRSGGSSCTRPSSRSRIRSRASGSRLGRRSRPTSRRTSRDSADAPCRGYHSAVRCPSTRWDARGGRWPALEPASTEASPENPQLKLRKGLSCPSSP